MLKSYSCTLSLVDKDKVKRVYLVDDSRSLKIMYNEMYNDFIITFKEYHKTQAVSTNHFHITGVIYGKFS